MSLFMSYVRDRKDPCNFTTSLSRGAHFQHYRGKPPEVISFYFCSQRRSVSLVRVKANPTIISENDNIIPLLAQPREACIFYMLCSHSVVPASLLPCGNCRLPGSSVLGILQARILEPVAFSCSRGSFWPRQWTRSSCVSCRLWQVVSFPLATWASLFVKLFL